MKLDLKLYHSTINEPNRAQISVNKLIFLIESTKCNTKTVKSHHITSHIHTSLIQQKNSKNSLHTLHEGRNNNRATITDRSMIQKQIKNDR